VSGDVIRHALHTPSWLRRNRWGLIGLPFALTAALVGSSDRVKLYFWDEDLNRPHHAAQGEWLTFEDTYNDAEGEHPMRVKVRLEGVTEATAPWASASELELPDGAQAVKVTLDFEADPDLPLAGCHLAVLDAAGTRYEYLQAIGMTQPYSPCVPPDTPGPDYDLGQIDEGRAPDDTPPRPETWSTSPVISLPAGVTIDEVALWWELPDYASFAVAKP
jgi:hypothetical protein